MDEASPEVHGDDDETKKRKRDEDDSIHNVMMTKSNEKV